MENKINFIKIFDERIAHTLSDGGFSYTEENINDGQTVFCFEETPELKEALRTLYGDGNYEGAIFVRDGALLF